MDQGFKKIQDSVYWKYIGISNSLGVSEISIRRTCRRAKLKLKEHKGTLYLPKSQLGEFVLRLERSSKFGRLILRSKGYDWNGIDSFKSKKWYSENEIQNIEIKASLKSRIKTNALLVFLVCVLAF